MRPIQQRRAANAAARERGRTVVSSFGDKLLKNRHDRPAGRCLGQRWRRQHLAGRARGQTTWQRRACRASSTGRLSSNCRRAPRLSSSGSAAAPLLPSSLADPAPLHRRSPPSPSSLSARLPPTTNQQVCSGRAAADLGGVVSTALIGELMRVNDHLGLDPHVLEESSTRQMSCSMADGASECVVSAHLQAVKERIDRCRLRVAAAVEPVAAADVPEAGQRLHQREAGVVHEPRHLSVCARGRVSGMGGARPGDKF